MPATLVVAASQQVRKLALSQLDDLVDQAQPVRFGFRDLEFEVQDVLRSRALQGQAAS